MRNSSVQKILTIAIPAYNIEDYIDRAVSNIVACRALPAIDVIVVNDGSTDSTIPMGLMTCFLFSIAQIRPTWF